MSVSCFHTLLFKDLEETTALSERRIRVLTADNGELRVRLSKDNSRNSSGLEVKGDSDESVVIIVDISNVIIGQGAMGSEIVRIGNVEVRGGSRGSRIELIHSRR